MHKPKDYYRILGVPRDAPLSVIKRAYRRLARLHHPDVSAGGPPDDFHEVQAAYETLADAERRRRYDESLSVNEDRDVSPFEPLAWSFVRSPAAGDLRRPVRPGSLSGEILLTPEEAAVGGVLPLDIPVDAHCHACGGTGGALFDCQRCDGNGSVQRRFPIPLRIPAGVREGATFQVTVDDPSVLAVVLTVHIRAL
jgi:DnaJ-class molecular chaperone